MSQTSSSIHNTLADMAKTAFPKFKDRQAVQRTVAHTAAKYIWFLGFSIALRSPSKQLEKICNGLHRRVNTNDERF